MRTKGRETYSAIKTERRRYTMITDLYISFSVRVRNPICLTNLFLFHNCAFGLAGRNELYSRKIIPVFGFDPSSGRKLYPVLKQARLLNSFLAFFCCQQIRMSRTVTGATKLHSCFPRVKFVCPL